MHLNIIKEVFPCVFGQRRMINSFKKKLIRRALNVIEYSHRLDHTSKDRKHILVYENGGGNEEPFEKSEVVCEEKFYEVWL